MDSVQTFSGVCLLLISPSGEVSSEPLSVLEDPRLQVISALIPHYTGMGPSLLIHRRRELPLDCFAQFAGGTLRKSSADIFSRLRV